MEQKLHTPEGVRDIYTKECRKKLAVQEKLHDLLHLYGYQDIQTPTFEYFDVFRKEIGTISSKELYKFFDREGNTLVLRPDITPSIARAAATLFEEEDFPIRLCYVGNTFINHSSYQGRLKENTQLGAELIGVDTVEADAELLSMVVDGLKKIGFPEFQVMVGHVDFIRELLDATGLCEEATEEIRSLITNRNYFGVEEILEEEGAAEEIKAAFRMLPELVGGVEVLEKAAEIAPGMHAKTAVERLQRIYRILQYYGVDGHVSFDLSMCGNYMYYTGIIFRAYTYGTGDAVVRGGRYDHLLEKFGKSTPSIGFAMIVDDLTSALSRQKISVETKRQHLIVYTEKTLKWAVSLAREFRGKNRCVELIKKEDGDSRESVLEYGKRMQAYSMLWLYEDGSLEMTNLETGVRKVVPARENN